MKNKLFKVVLTAGVGVTIGVIVRKAWEFLQQKKEAEEKSAAIKDKKEAINRAIFCFKRLNNLSKNAIRHVDVFEQVPIFAYDRRLNIENMRIPEGCTLLKLIQIQPSGEITYVLGKMSDDELITDYHILAYFVEDWDEPEF